jgi:hypothetical protein
VEKRVEKAAPRTPTWPTPPTRWRRVEDQLNSTQANLTRLRQCSGMTPERRLCVQPEPGGVRFRVKQRACVSRRPFSASCAQV